MRRLGTGLVTLPLLLATMSFGTAGAQSSDSHPRDAYLLVPVDNTLFFNARNPSDPGDFVLWKSNGTPQGTQVVKDVNGNGSGYCCSANTAGAGGLLYFMGSEADFDNEEPWVSDGTADGTRMLKDINADPDGGTCCYDHGFESVDGTTFFQVFEGPTGYTIWKSDGTTDGTVRMKDFEAPGTSCDNCGDANFFLKWKDKLFFSGPSDGQRGNEALWRSNGTTEGTVELATRSSPWTPVYLRPAGDILFFFAEIEYFQGTRRIYELWSSDGTSDGTKRVLDRSFARTFDTPVTYRGKLYFAAATESPWQERLWKSDGTAQGTRPFQAPGMARRSYPGDKIVFKNRLYFVARDTHHNRELWRTNGTDQGTKRLKDVNPGTLYDINNFTVVGDTLFFTLGEHGHRELWKSDGTKRGTVRVTKTSWDFVNDFVAMGGRLYFSARPRPNDSHDLWTSDGTANGTHPIYRTNS